MRWKKPLASLTWLSNSILNDINAFKLRVNNAVMEEHNYPLPFIAAALAGCAFGLSMVSAVLCFTRGYKPAPVENKAQEQRAAESKLERECKHISSGEIFEIDGRKYSISYDSEKRPQIMPYAAERPENH